MGRSAFSFTDAEEKQRAIVAMVDRFFPDRTAGLRPRHKQEIKATSFIAMEIEEASAKVRSKGVADDDEDYELPIYAERHPGAHRVARPSRWSAADDGRETAGDARRISEGACSEMHADAFFAEYPETEIGLRWRPAF